MQTVTQNQEKNKEVSSPGLAIPERDILCGKNRLNLTSYYTESLDDNIHHKPGNTLSDLPKGLQNFGGIDFDIRGVIQLAGHRSEEITTLVYPPKITGIAVDMKGKSVHFLHASAWNIDFEPMEIGSYQINYDDGESEQIKITYRMNIWDWWSSKNDLLLNPVWKGKNNRTTAIDQHIRLFLLTWNNPHPEKEIISIDLITNSKGPGPMIIAISISQ